jgi:type VI secretion system protein VasD
MIRRPAVLPVRTRRLFCRDLLVLPGLLALGGCGGGTPSVKTTSLEFAIEADQEINPNENGEPSPIVLRVYELKTKSAFEQASFFELLDSDTQKLGPDLVAKREFEVKPGDKSTFTRDSPSDAKHIGVIAGFRQIDSATWRSVVDIVPDRTNSFLIALSSTSVKITLAGATRSMPSLF